MPPASVFVKHALLGIGALAFVVVLCWALIVAVLLIIFEYAFH